MAPISSEAFTEKVLKAQESSTAAAAKAAYEKVCQVCQKTYYSENTYNDHVQGQRHKARVAAIEKDAEQNGTKSVSVLSSTISLGTPLEPKSPAGDVDSDGGEDFSTMMNGFKQTKITDKRSRNGKSVGERLQLNPARRHMSKASIDSSPSSVADTTESQASGPMPIVRCMFCNYDSPNLKLNVHHMEKFHALFIPERTFLVALEGLVAYFQLKISENHECIFCHKLKSSMTGCQTHMRDKGHCMIAFETEAELLEVGQFYDFRGSYSDSEDDDEDNEDDVGPADSLSRRQSASSRLGRKRASSTATGDNEDGWETDSSDSVATAEITAVPIDPDYHRLPSHKHHTHTDPRRHLAADGFHSHASHAHHAAFHSDGELLMPTGRTAGHRGLAKYYRQNLRHRGNSQESEEGMQHRMITAGNGAGGSEEQAEGGGEVVRRGRSGGHGVVTRANGGRGMMGVTEAKKREAKGAEKRDECRAKRAEMHYQLGVSRRANSQKYFRDELLQ